MPSQSEIVTHESLRLNSLGIPYQYIHISEGKPIVIVDPTTMSRIVSERKSGKNLQGMFICDLGNKSWSASVILDGKHVYSDGLTECKAYRTVLGYKIGHYTRNVRYIGQYPYRQRAKAKRH